LAAESTIDIDGARALLSLVEFFAPDDDDCTDRFEYLDVNSNGHLERVEWHGTLGEFSRFDWTRTMTDT